MNKYLLAKYGTLLVLFALIVVAPFFFPSAFYFRVGSIVFTNAIAVIGIVILTGYVGQISLGHAGFMGIGAYTCALAPLHLGIPVALAAVLGAVISGFIAWVVGRPILKLKGYYLSVATLGFGILISMVLTNEAWLTGGPDGINVNDLDLRAFLRSWGIKLTNSEFWYAISGFLLVLAAFIAFNLRYSTTGRAMRALHNSEVAASTVGINVAKVKLQGFVISAVYASFAGSLIAMQNRFITPDIASFKHSIEVVTMAVLGGASSVLGAVLGSLLLTALPQVLTFLQEYEEMVLGLVMMLIMIFMRKGLLPSISAMVRGRG